MSIYLGNIQFSDVEEKLGYKLTDEDKTLWNKYHSQSADLSDKPSCFHVFDIPTCIQFKGEEAKDAILKMFTPEKMTKAVGRFMVYEKPNSEQNVQECDATKQNQGTEAGNIKQ